MLSHRLDFNLSHLSGILSLMFGARHRARQLGVILLTQSPTPAVSRVILDWDELFLHMKRDEIRYRVLRVPIEPTPTVI